MNVNTRTSEITTVEQAIALLGQCYDISGIGNAIEYLEQRALRYQLLFLYSYYFSKQFSQSTALVYLDPKIDEEWLKYTKLRHLCFKTRFPICYLPLTLKLLDQNTNNIWLDEDGGWTQGMEGTTLDWSIENIDYLHREYLKAQRILDAVGFLIDWLENDLTTNFLYIVKIWNQCTIRQ